MALLTALQPRRIAVFRALQLGDMLCAVPALRAVRAACPDAAITLIGLPWARDFADRLAYVDDFMEFPGYPGLVEIAPDLARLPAFFAEAHARRFDLAIQMHGSGTISNPLIAALGARRTAGFVAPGAWCPDYEAFMPWPRRGPEIRRLLALAAFIGAPARGEALELAIRADERSAFETLRAALSIGHAGYACVHPGARLASRRWHADRFAAVADALADAGLTVVLTGAAAEASIVAKVRERMRRPAIDLVGRTTLGMLAALVGEARLVVCNDTGISHVAAAMRTPSVVICCGADPERWRPLDAARHRVLWHSVPCRPCEHAVCPTGHECALHVRAAAAIAEAMRLLAATASEISRAAA